MKFIHTKLLNHENKQMNNGKMSECNQMIAEMNEWMKHASVEAMIDFRRIHCIQITNFLQ